MVTRESRHLAVELELSKKASVNQTLQNLCRTLSSQNTKLNEQLEAQLSRERESSKQSESLQKAVLDITAR